MHSFKYLLQLTIFVSACFLLAQSLSVPFELVPPDDGAGGFTMALDSREDIVVYVDLNQDNHLVLRQFDLRHIALGQSLVLPLTCNTSETACKVFGAIDFANQTAWVGVASPNVTMLASANITSFTLLGESNSSAVVGPTGYDIQNITLSGLGTAYIWADSWIGEIDPGCVLLQDLPVPQIEKLNITLGYGFLTNDTTLVIEGGDVFISFETQPLALSYIVRPDEFPEGSLLQQGLFYEKSLAYVVSPDKLMFFQYENLQDAGSEFNIDAGGIYENSQENFIVAQNSSQIFVATSGAVTAFNTEDGEINGVASFNDSVSFFTAVPLSVGALFLGRIVDDDEVPHTYLVLVADA